MLSVRLVPKFAAAITAAAVFAIAGAAFAAGTYASSYTSYDQSINENATVVLQNGSGYYILSDGSQGQLSFTITQGTLPPAPPGAPIPGPSLIYDGFWSYLGDSGTFTWTVSPNGATFSGVWTDLTSGESGVWSGYRGNGPLPPPHP